MDPHTLTVLMLLAFLAYFVKGVTGAAGAIVFNAGFLTLAALGWAGQLTLLDALYWVAMADFVAGLVMAVLLRKELKSERLVVLLLIGMLPVMVVFTLLLPSFQAATLGVTLALVVVATGLYQTFRPEPGTGEERDVTRWALPTGALGGVLGGLFGMSGPVVFVLFGFASSDPSVFRRRVLIVSTSSSVIRLAVIALSGGLTLHRVEQFGITMPALFLGMVGGMRIHRYVKPRPFRVALGLLVVLAGIGALLKYVT